ncbi:Diguanylate phosphodiesterase [Bordetella sputigena]|uniref:bifunctional diguanylate cyclase/phosphodiesterase n=1 Tax=Bordetella sputigena TaxID=1416810 RepID=UPI0039EFBBC6
MSLLRQLLVSVAAVTALLLIGSQMLNIDAARRYLGDELRARGEIAATTLAAVFGREPAGDEDTWRAVARDIFASGAYRRIEVRGGPAFEYVKQDPPGAVPDWFASLIAPRPPAAARSFKTVEGVPGTVTVIADDTEALRALWRHSVGLALLVGFAGLCWLVYARGMVRRLQKRVLQGISAQVRALARGDSDPPVALPPWREVADVADALAEARARLRMTAEEAHARIESLQLELNLDAVTRLPNRKYFFNELRRALTAGRQDSNAESGHVLMFRQRDLAAINRHMPRDITDQWLRSVGLRLDQKLGRHHVPPYLLARLNGSDFALLLQGVPASQAGPLAEQLRQELRALRVSLGENQWCRWALAVAPYSRGDHASELLALLDHALMRAESADTDVPVGAEPLGTTETAGELQWRDTLVMALEQHRFSLTSQALRVADGVTLRHEGTLMLHDADAQAPIPAHVFMPAAIRLSLSPECDIQAIRLALDWLVSHGGDLSVALALPSLGQSNFLPRLGQMLGDRPAQAGRLVLEVEARGLLENFNHVRALCTVVCEVGARIGVSRLADDFSVMTRLHELPVAYVKLGASFVEAMARSPGSRHLAASVRETAKGLGVEVYADGRADEDTAAFLARQGIVLVGYAAETLPA